MGYLRHVHACNRFDAADFRPLAVGAVRVGWLTPLLAWQLCDYPFAFADTGDGVVLAAATGTPETRSATFAAICGRLAGAGALPPPRGEIYPVGRDRERPLALIDRAWVPPLGLRAWGVHVNGIVRDGPRTSLWIARRSAARTVAPGKLDGMVGGGLPHAIGADENLVREAAEEAGLPAALARGARRAGTVSYTGTQADGLRDDVLFCYDLEMPPDVAPRAADGEVDSFTLMPVDEVLARVRETDDFKFNAALVVIDFALRRGFITPDDADYEALRRGLGGGA